MKAKTKFKKMFYKLPKESRINLVLCPYGLNPMSLNVVKAEIDHDTEKGIEALKDMGYDDS